MESIDDISKAYLIAGLSLGNEIEGFVDSYHGPEELQAQAKAMSPSVAMDRLEHELSALEPSHRRAYLLAQLRAMRTVWRTSRGEDVPYREQVMACFDIDPVWTEERAFESAHYALDHLLPGSGTIADRRKAYRRQLEIPNDRISSLAAGILDDLRARTKAILPLPEGERFELALVSDKPWSGYNWYLGDYTSRIEINTDLPVHANDLPDLLAHEGYPGHHTEHSIREAVQLRQHGQGEFAIALLNSPQAVVSEGIATNAFDVVVPTDEQPAWLSEHIYGPAGIEIDVERDLAIRQAGRTLGDVRDNAALMVLEQGQSVDQAVEYIVRYGLRTEAEARRSMQFATHPLFSTYVYTYSVGYELVSGYLQSRQDAAEAFRSLMTGHWTPTRLRGSDRRRSSDDERLPI